MVFNDCNFPDGNAMLFGCLKKNLSYLVFYVWIFHAFVSVFWAEFKMEFVYANHVIGFFKFASKVSTRHKLVSNSRQSMGGAKRRRAAIGIIFHFENKTLILKFTMG